MNWPSVVITSVSAVPEPGLAGAERRPTEREVLMVSPEHFEVAYVINPHMRTAAGDLQRVDASVAGQQWRALAAAYEAIGFPVRVLPGLPGLPDMVFVANPAFPFVDRGGVPWVLPSRMRHEQRQGEVQAVLHWLVARGFTVASGSNGGPTLEGCGDLLWVPGRRVVLLGHGFRSDPAVLGEVAERVDAPVVGLRLVDDRFYHLDTCLQPLDHSRALWVPDAFDGESQRLLGRLFPVLLPVAGDEGVTHFAGNAHCPDGRHVIVDSGAVETARRLEEEGFRVIGVPTGEFRKSGGSVFCMKLMLP